MSNPVTVPMLSPEGQPGDVPLANVQNAISKGFKQGVDMIAPDGTTPGVVPMDKVHDAINAGFSLKGVAPATAPTVQMQSSLPGYAVSGGQALVDYVKGLAKGGLGTTAVMGAAAGGPQYLQGGGINQPQVNYTPPQSIQPQGTAQKAGYYTEKVGEIVAPFVVGGATAAQLLPSTERAGAAIQSVSDAAGSLPVDTSGPMQIAQRIKQLGSAGGTVPKVVRDFLNRMGISVEGETVTQAPSRLTFNEGRDFYNNSTRLASGEFQNLTPPVQRLVNQFTGSLHGALVGSADQVGMGQTYDNAIREYASSSAMQRGARGVGKWAMEQLLRYGVPTALGYEAYQAMKKGQ